MLRDHGIFYWWEKRGNQTSLVAYPQSISFHYLLCFTLVRKDSCCIGFLSVLTHIVQLVLDMQALATYEGRETALILSICFDNMKTSSVWAIEENIGFTDKLLMDFSHKKCSSKEFIYLIICLFVRN